MIYTRTILLGFSFLSFGLAFSQVGSSTQNWAVLSEIDYDKSEDEYGEIYVPIFGDEIRNLEGERIVLEGFIIPFQGMFEPDKIILSALPIASCFFCGGSGPETVAEVFLDRPIRYTAKTVRVTGTLELNDTDADQLMYILKNSQLEIL